eukprot:TRINITY_DN9308_c1_g4_i1.p1 TRINITY_DN9308_c1_g4~~TRINITY_DN9308_c1_g4_i1.p1  ORF type:complete len:318 (+),score=73.04 TRINITY_DN9308_c1_g4_i1:100-1053(+)
MPRCLQEDKAALASWRRFAGLGFRQSRRSRAGYVKRFAKLGVLVALFACWTPAVFLPVERSATTGLRSAARRAPTLSRKRATRNEQHLPAAPKNEADAEDVFIEMQAPLAGKIGVAILGGRRTVSRLTHEDAFSCGWRVGDVIDQVNGNSVGTNDALKAAVEQALAESEATGAPLKFRVKRKAREPDTAQSMLRMTPGTGGAISVPMVQLVRGMLSDFPVVIFVDGTINSPNNNLSARAIQALLEVGVAFKAVDCSDERYNPGVRNAIEELTGEFALPQLFISGASVGNGYATMQLHTSGELRKRLLASGAILMDPE